MRSPGANTQRLPRYLLIVLVYSVYASSCNGAGENVEITGMLLPDALHAREVTLPSLHVYTQRYYSFRWELATAGY